MKVETKEMKMIVLVLTEDEASWLKGVMQNPLWDEDIGIEDDNTQEKRQTLFNSLKDAGIF